MNIFQVTACRPAANEQFNVGGRNCGRDLSVGDLLFGPDCLLVIQDIELYHKRRAVFASGYVGTLYVKVLNGKPPKVDSVLFTDDPSEFVGESLGKEKPD
jgi:hypothetical protein